MTHFIKFFLPKKIFISHLPLKDNFVGYRILVECVGVLSLQHFKWFTPLSSCLYGFWREVQYNSYPCFSVGKDFLPPVPPSFFQNFVFGFVQFEYDILRYEFLYLPCLVFFELLGYVVQILSSLLDISHHYYFK